MAQINPPPRSPLLLLRFFLLFLLLLTAAAPSHSFSYAQYKSLFSLSHSLLTRVSNLRAARGDISGANRAKLIAQKLERGLGGLGFWGFAWSVGWDYVKNYAWRDIDYGETNAAAAELNELVAFVNELNRLDSDSERAAWVASNYSNVLRVAKLVLHRFGKVFHHSRPLKEVVETVQREVVEGGLLRDCLELGNNDLKGLLQMVKDLASQHGSASGYRGEL